MNPNLQETLINLRSRQNSIQDGYRLYKDGSIKTITITESLETGWHRLANSVPGSAALIYPFFPNEFLKTDSMREAIAIRDEIIKYMADTRSLSSDSGSAPNLNTDKLPVLL